MEDASNPQITIEASAAAPEEALAEDSVDIVADVTTIYDLTEDVTQTIPRNLTDNETTSSMVPCANFDSS